MYNKPALFFLSGVLYFMISTISSAQVADAGMRMNVAGDVKWSNKWNSTFTLENRLNDNFSRWSIIYVAARLQYKISKPASVSLSYRTILANPSMAYREFRQRLYADFSYKFKIHNFSITPRTRIQCQFTQNYLSDISERIRAYWRNKITLKYGFKKWAPYVEGELFYTLNNNEGNEINRYRLVAGTEFELSKKTSIDIFYLRDEGINVNNPLTMHVLGLAYNFSFSQLIRQHKQSPPPHDQ